MRQADYYHNKIYPSCYAGYLFLFIASDHYGFLRSNRDNRNKLNEFQSQNLHTKTKTTYSSRNPNKHSWQSIRKRPTWWLADSWFSPL